MSDTAGATPAERLGLAEGQVVLEMGWDDDVDGPLREQVEQVTGAPLEDEDYDGVADAVLLWFRDGDGDLTDDCVDSLTTLADGGFVVLCVPGAGHPDHVDASDIQEAATTAGLNVGSQARSGDWIMTKLEQSGGRR